MRPNFTLSYGLRYEGQTNIGSILNFGPRLAFCLVAGSGEQRQATEDGDSRRRRRFLQSLQRRQHAASQSLQRRQPATVFGSRGASLSMLARGAREHEFSLRRLARASGQTAVGHLQYFAPSSLSPLDAFPALPSTSGLTADAADHLARRRRSSGSGCLPGGRAGRTPAAETVHIVCRSLSDSHSTRDSRARRERALPGSITQANPAACGPMATWARFISTSRAVI